MPDLIWRYTSPYPGFVGTDYLEILHKVINGTWIFVLQNFHALQMKPFRLGAVIAIRTYKAGRPFFCHKVWCTDRDMIDSSFKISDY